MKYAQQKIDIQAQNNWQTTRAHRYSATSKNTISALTRATPLTITFTLLMHLTITHPDPSALMLILLLITILLIPPTASATVGPLQKIRKACSPQPVKLTQPLLIKYEVQATTLPSENVQTIIQRSFSADITEINMPISQDPATLASDFTTLCQAVKNTENYINNYTNTLRSTIEENEIAVILQEAHNKKHKHKTETIA
jgi:hypothetical protein